MVANRVRTHDSILSEHENVRTWFLSLDSIALGLTRAAMIQTTWVGRSRIILSRLVSIKVFGGHGWM
jgi:hypothetical protein